MTGALMFRRVVGRSVLPRTTPGADVLLDARSGLDQSAALASAVHEVRPGSSAPTAEYGQPGIICAWPFPRPYT